MIIYDLICECGFEIEAWFTSLHDYQNQVKHKQIVCPLCSSTKINKKISAPHINSISSHQLISDDQNHSTSAAGPTKKVYEGVATRPRNRKQVATINQTKEKSISELNRTLGKIIEALIRSSDNVGSNFVQEARKIHNNQAPMRTIRGEATMEEFFELQEEGIECIPLPIPSKKDLN